MKLKFLKICYDLILYKKTNFTSKISYYLNSLDSFYASYTRRILTREVSKERKFPATLIFSNHTDELETACLRTIHEFSLGQASVITTLRNHTKIYFVSQIHLYLIK